MHRVLVAVVALLFAGVAQAAPWQSAAVNTAEGDRLVVEKKGRQALRLRIESAERSESIRCPAIYGHQRTDIALLLQSAGERAKSDEQIGPIVPYQEALLAMRRGYGADMAMLANMCALGITALPDKVSITVGNTGKQAGRTATLRAVDAIELGAWLQAR